MALCAGHEPENSACCGGERGGLEGPDGHMGQASFMPFY